MAIRTLLWRGLDAPRMEIVRVESLDRAHGTQIGISYELRWKLDGPVLELTMDGGPGIRVELGDADFFDLHHSAFFNSLPVARDGLLDEGATAREYTMRFVRVPELTAEPAWQRYEPLASRWRAGWCTTAPTATRRTSPSMPTGSSPSTRTISNGSGEACVCGSMRRAVSPRLRSRRLSVASYCRRDCTAAAWHPDARSARLAAWHRCRGP
jgi:uncharacterized protein